MKLNSMSIFYLVIDVHLSPLCSPRFRIGRASELEISLSQFITELIVR
jgi:exosome complex RNA-binding protein Rrp42 (RNase PH superfamily)